MSRWQKFLRLSSPERRAFLSAFCAVAGISLGLRLAGFRRMHSMLLRSLRDALPASPQPQQASSSSEARLLARMVAAAARQGVVPGKCLEQSLSLWWLLRRRGIPAQLRIGVRKAQEQFEGHAWIELSGEVLNDSLELYQDYAAFQRDFGRVKIESAPVPAAATGENGEAHS
jgi:hypothetical protein